MKSKMFLITLSIVICVKSYGFVFVCDDGTPAYRPAVFTAPPGFRSSSGAKKAKMTKEEVIKRLDAFINQATFARSNYDRFEGEMSNALERIHSRYVELENARNTVEVKDDYNFQVSTLLQEEALLMRRLSNFSGTLIASASLADRAINLLEEIEEADVQNLMEKYGFTGEDRFFDFRKSIVGWIQDELCDDKKYALSRYYVEEVRKLSDDTSKLHL